MTWLFYRGAIDMYATSADIGSVSSDVIAEIDKLVDKGTRTDFLVELARRAIKLHRQREALRTAAGSWNPDDHPELAKPLRGVPL